MLLSVCGLDCEKCPSFGGDCKGCAALQGRVYWTQYIEAGVCPVYKCVQDKSFKNCGDCSSLPCETWFSLKDPSLTDEEHKKSITERAMNLKGNQR